jgi:hypothetical protein
VTSSAVLPLPRLAAAQEQESPVVTGIAVALAGGLYVLATGIVVSGIMGMHTLPFSSPQLAHAYYGLALEDVLRPQLAQASMQVPVHH